MAAGFRAGLRLVRPTRLGCHRTPPGYGAQAAETVPRTSDEYLRRWVAVYEATPEALAAALIRPVGTDGRSEALEIASCRRPLRRALRRVERRSICG